MTRRALVTGATGFVGSHLARALAAGGWQVTAIVREGSDRTRVALLGTAGCTLASFDGDTASMARLVGEAAPDVVFHLATLFRGEHSVGDVAPLVAANVLFGAQLLEGMRLTGTPRLVTAGTAWEHHENRAYSPVSLYAATKGAFHALLAYYVEVARLSAVTLDLTDTYGPGDPRRKLVRLLLETGRTQAPLVMNGGEPYIDLLHVHDAVEAFQVAAERLTQAEPGRCERWSVRTDEPLRLRELVALVAQVTGRAIPVVWGGRAYRARETFTPWTSGERLPGWAPRVPLAEGISTVDA